MRLSICLLVSIMFSLSVFGLPHVQEMAEASVANRDLLQAGGDSSALAALVAQAVSTGSGGPMTAASGAGYNQHQHQQQQQQQQQLQRQQSPNGGQQQQIMKSVSFGQVSDASQERKSKRSDRRIEKVMLDRIINNTIYDKRIRPAGKFNATTGIEGPTEVRVNTLVRSISKIDDVTMEYSVQLTLRQEWFDDRLQFQSYKESAEYNISSITLTEQDRLWKPDLFFRNEKEGHFHKIIMPNVLIRIKQTGEVLYSIRISLVLACPMDLKYYPLDKQNCTIEMASYGYIDTELKFQWKPGGAPVQILQPLTLPRFTLERNLTDYCLSTTSTGTYSCLRIDLIFKREFSYYLIQIYIPCCMLVIVSWVSFWLDPNAIPARVSLGVTTLLTMATQISGINASLPPVSYTKAIDVWTGVCLTFVFGALLEFALVNYASRSDQHEREMLTTALTRTQQMRWREAAAAAASVGVAPPTSPPPDENSPSMLASKQQAFFGGPFVTMHPHTMPATGAMQHCNHALCQHQAGAATLQVANGGLGAEQQAPDELAPVTATAASQHQLIKSPPGGGPSLGGASNGNNKKRPLQIGSGTLTSRMTTRANANNPLPCTHQPGLAASNTCNASATGKFAPQINCALQYLCPREVNLMTQKPQKSKNWCKVWMAKFPTRSKRIDVISRIFFPLKFALFNLVYWTTYLFREEDTVA